MRVQRAPMTKNGFDQLTKELKKLKAVDRPQVVKEIEEARAHGDLSENAEYEAAKDKQALIQRRIVEIEDKLARADVIDPARQGDSGKVIFGATVILLEVEDEIEKRYQIVGEDEADIRAGKISVHSPVARAIIGKEVGDEVKIRTPGGERFYEILDVLF